MIDFNLLCHAFDQEHTIKNHSLIIKKGNTYQLANKNSFQNNGKTRLSTILKSLFIEIKNPERTEEDLIKALKIAKYFWFKNPESNVLISKIKDIFARFLNWIYGNGFKTTREMAHEIILYLESKNIKIPKPIKGFAQTDFWISMSKNRVNAVHPSFKTDSIFKIVLENYTKFCERIVGNPKMDYSNPPENASIPPIIHFIWMGSAVPEKVLKIIDTWREMHPGWTIKIWTDKDINSFEWEKKSAFDEAYKEKRWPEAADIWRYEILKKFGGVYSDTDVICFKSLNDLITHGITFFACQEDNQISTWRMYEKPLFLCNAVIGASKDNAVIQHCLDNLKPKSQPIIPTHAKKDLLHRTGPVLFSKACSAVLNSPEKDSLLILPCSYFYPLPWTRELNGKIVSYEEARLKYMEKESFAVHLWDGSW